ncbi:protein lava lamp [Bactrocera tryoni]|uniref:protein lava lamp n=1 Tax=Bactrocera tryoni TaxID=59916 RepID=UPI001A994301|nr:protein lava lamp [Bactrocera tryoni]XP_039961628.1 protein lava lamp [Bactrocera tryoni]
MSSSDPNEHAANISNLQESFSKQQKKISALKELVRKSEAAHGKSTSTTQAKVKNIAQCLTNLKNKARSRQSLPASNSSTVQENVTTFAPNETIEPVLEHYHQPTQQQGPPQLTHSFSYVEQNVGVPLQYAQTSTPNFTPLKSQHRSDSSKSLTSSTMQGSEKVQLLRQQMEQNKLLMAQRASSKQHLEQLVSQLKEKFDTTQQCLEDTNELGKSMSDLSALMVRSPTSRERHKSATDLSSQPFSLERERIKFLENRCRLLEKQLEKERQVHGTQEATTANESKKLKELENKVVELEKSLQERQSEIENKIGETQQLAEELERTRSDVSAKDEELCLMRLKQGDTSNDFTELADLENNDIERLRNELADKHVRINELEEINDMLEANRCELTLKNNKYEEQIEQLKLELNAANEKVQTVEEELKRSEEKCASLAEVLEKLQNTTEAVVVETGKPVNITSVQVSEEMAKQIQELRDECDKLLVENSQLKETISEQEKLEVSDASIAEKIAALESTIESQREDLKERQTKMSRMEEEVMEKTIEFNVLNANFKVLEEKLEAASKSKSLFSSIGGEAADNPALEAEIQQLKQKLDESNKAMIKLKLKCKQTEKQVEKLKKSSDLHAENVRLTALSEELQQKITELEDEKGQWQLTQVDTAAKTPDADNTEEQEERIAEFEEKLKTQVETVRLLEEQKYEQAQRLEVAEEKLRELQEQIDSRDGEETRRVKSEMSEIQLEEKLEEQAQQLQQLEERLAKAHVELEEHKQKVAELQEQKQAADKKLENYMVENMELLDKIEKLSKSSSSAESIEIVERLTQQERAEIDEYNKQQLDGTAVNSVNELTQTELAPELSDSLVKLREESSELMNKIELFTTERREVLERMEHLTAENHELIEKVEELTREKEDMETNVLLANDAKIKLEERIKELSKEKDQLAVQVAEFKVQGNQLSQELSSLQKSSEVVAALDSKDDAALIAKCEKCLTNLSHELEIYRKANDKNAKFNASKKLAKEAKNAHTQLSELLQKVKEASTAVETVTVVETVVAVTAPNGKALAEYEQLTTQNRLLKERIKELQQELQEAREADDADTTAVPTTQTAAVPALTEDQTTKEQREKQLEELKQYEEQCVELQSTVENLRLQLVEARTAGEERSGEITQLNEELEALRKSSSELESLLSDKNLTHEQELKELTRLRRELEGKCDTYEGEMNILQTLVTEQKQQLIEAYKEHEHENNMKLLDLQERDEQILQLRDEIKELKHALTAAGDQLTEDLRKECEKLREALKINKNLVTEQVNELSNKQETIEMLNQQIIDLYKTMEENANNIIDKEDEIASLQETLDSNSKELERLRKDNVEQKTVVDKLLIELHSHRATVEQLPQLESELQRLEEETKKLDSNNKELEKRNKDQLEKLKKYAANLKKRAAQCQELEAKVSQLEKGSLEAMQTKQQDAGNDEELTDHIKQLENQIDELKTQVAAKTADANAATEYSERLKTQLEGLERSLAEKNSEIVQLQVALVDAQEQTAGWGDSALDLAHTDNAESEELKKKLEEKTHKLQEAEAEIYSMQEELIQVRESEREKFYAIKDIQEALQHKSELVAELQRQMQSHTQADDITQTLEDKVQTFEERLQTLTEELKAKSIKFEKSKAVIKERNNQIQRLQAQLKDLQDKLSARPEEEYIGPPLNVSVSEATAAPTQAQVPKDAYDDLQVAYEKLSERFAAEQSSFQATIARLETLHDGIQAKLQENMSYIETLEQDNTAYKEKICRLEEGIATFEERRASMERRTNLLCAQMQTRETEHEQAEDELLYRLNMLSEHDDVIAQRLLQAQEEKDDLQERIERMQAECSQLSNNYAKMEKEYQAYRTQNETLAAAETQQMREQLTAARAELEQLRTAYEAKLAVKTTELDELESELSEQLSKMNSEKRLVAEELERAHDALRELNNNYLKMETEYRTYREQSEANSVADTQQVREQLSAAQAELEHLRGEYDAKLAVKTTQLDELESELSEQLAQMNNDKRATAEALERAQDECNAQKDEIVRLKESLNALEQAKQELEREATWLRLQNEGSQQDQYELQELRMQAMQDKTEIDNLRHQIETLAGNHEVELQALRTQISELDTLRMQVGQNQTDDQVFIETENKRLTDLLAEKEAIIENYQRQNLQLQMAAAAAAQQPAATQQDPLALAFGLPPLGQSSTSHTAPPADENARLQRELLEKTEQLARLQHELNALQSELHSSRDGNHELQRQLAAKQQEIDNLRSTSYNNTPTAAAVFGQQPQQDVIPAPLFFSTEQATPSPFDEIVQVRTIDNLGSGARSHSVNNPVNTAIEQPTIEDLQRNVSDLEKHAQELENKLATRNQRELEIEERLRETQQSLSECERQLRERAEELNAARAELQQVFAANEALKAADTVAHQELEQLRGTLAASQTELAQREHQLKQLETRLQETRVHSDSQAATDLMGLGQLQGNLEQLQTMLQQRDDELSQLRRALEDEKTLKERTSAIESQIIPDTLANLGIVDAPNAVPTLDMFFGGANSGANDFEKLVIPPVSNVPVVEEMIVPEKAYICQPDGQTAHSQQDAVAFDFGDDFGDVWGAQEAAAEEEHFSKTAAGRLGAPVSLVPREQQLEIQLAEQAERIAELQLTVERCEQQRQELQVKSGKLMKKLKEYKTKIDELQSTAGKTAKSADASASFFDLDAAIQDELKAQIKQLENTLQEERKQHELHGVEREKLLKRIDVLTAGSERMTEMKERQDMEVQMYQARIKELQTKVNQLEDWGPDTEAGKEATSEGQQLQQREVAQSTATVASAHGDYAPLAPPSTWEIEKQQLNQRIAELTAEIADINVDRQELQALLEDEKANVQRAEEAQKILQQQLSARDIDFTATESAEKAKYNELKVDHHQLQEKYNVLHATCEEQTGELNRLKAREEQLNAALQQAEQNLATTSATSAQEETLKAALAKAESNLEQANAELSRLESDLTTVQSQLLELQAKNAEVLQANEELRQANTLAVTTQQAETSQLSAENQQLRAQNEALEQRVQVLQQDLSKQASATVSVGSLSGAVDVDELNAQLQEKESEIMHLKQRIEDLMREDQTEKLVLEILTKNQEIHLLKMQVKNLEDDKQELEHNLAVQITSEMQAKKSDLDGESAQLRERTTQLEQQLQALQSEKHDMEEELKVLNNHVMSSLENEDKLKAAALQLDTQSIEIAELRRTIEALRANGSAAAGIGVGAPTAPTPADYAALNAQWEAIVEQKCGEIAKMWREHLEQREAEFKMTEARLHDEIAAAAQRQAQSHEQGTQPGNSAETTATSTPASVSTSQSGTSSGTASKDGTPLRHRIINEEHESDADAIIEKMQAALESQEMEIVTLKEQLAIRSAEYARLAAQYDPFKLQNTSSHSGISGGMPPESRRPANTPSGNDATLVPKSELDFALYMLHQRDMRCEEMTVELVSLLEERDTLQLKLSNTLRQVEAIKVATNYVEPPTAPADNAALASPTAATFSQPRSAAAAGDSATELSQKLSQLQTVNHSKDKVIKEERDQRIRQMEKIQQDVAKMPQAAVSELVGTDAAQSGQSPSSVLLNWLWGNKPDAGGSAPH